MTYTWTFICDLRGGCGAVIKLRSDRYDGHGYIKCPVCHGNCSLQGRE